MQMLYVFLEINLQWYTFVYGSFLFFLYFWYVIFGNMAFANVAQLLLHEVPFISQISVAERAVLCAILPRVSDECSSAAYEFTGRCNFEDRRWKDGNEKENRGGKREWTRRQNLRARLCESARCEIRSFRWHFPERGCNARRRLPSLNASSAIGLLQGSLLSAARRYLVSLYLSSSFYERRALKSPT